MKTTNNTVLITGGSAGIGFQIAKAFIEKGNDVIITGRDEARLKAAAARLGRVTTITGDVSDPADVERLVSRIEKDFPALNILVNNAGRVYVHDFNNFTGVEAKALDELTTNYLSVIGLTEKLLPVLKRQPEAAVVNVTSIVALVPGAIMATYSASKAALHSYTQSLRLILQKTAVKVFELYPPLVNTEFSKEIGGEQHGIAPEVVADRLLTGLAADESDIRVGMTEDLYRFSLTSPEGALQKLNEARL
ncbi:MAG TPA: SDR family NAD(P)-dependent oxidoreductase [Dinghuibacter sp.]|uniref:SDR family oxidoreductase n=1 Tax=Dinghuibacter sp. TaxID=2024697 RepID=UPI002B55153B|nr:SDR family NAD(P)-dependent oxidoreductase [Dinghuibacter sp.]HTJ12842.1 SDR family NAD(P)-dependent oxidoreductase [Dinghuibacter sp.]